MNAERMTDRLETERLVLFPYTRENLALFNSDLPAFEREFGVVYRGEELDHLLKGFLLKLERELSARQSELDQRIADLDAEIRALYDGWSSNGK